MNHETPPDYESPLKLEEGAEHMRVSLKTLRRLVKNGALRAFKIGGQWFILGSEIQAYFHRQMARGGGQT